MAGVGCFQVAESKEGALVSATRLSRVGDGIRPGGLNMLVSKTLERPDRLYSTAVSLLQMSANAESALRWAYGEER